MSINFRQVHTKFWSDRYITSLPSEQKLVFAYLLTNEKTSYCGIYEIAIDRIVFDLKLKDDVVMDAIDKFTKDNKIIYNYETGEMALVNWRKHNPENKKFGKQIERELGLVKDKELISAVMNGHAYKPSAPAPPKKTKEPKTNSPINIPFSDFRKAYDRTTGDMKRAERLWEQLKDQEREAVMVHVPLLVADTAGDRKKFRPHPATYLNQRRWENEIVPESAPPPVIKESKFSADW